MSISSTHIDLRLPQQTAAISWADYINQLVEDWRTHIRQHMPPEENLHYCISNMEIGGAALLFPQPSPLDINTFTLRGTNIGNHLLKDQNMELKCEFKCIEHAHGSITITANHQDLNFDFLFENVPSALLLDLNISEGANTGLRAYRPDGHMNIHLKLQFNNKINTGQVNITSRDLLLHPDEDQPALIRNIAKTIKQLRALEPQAEIKWSMDWLRHRGSVTKMNFRFNEFLQNMHQRIQAIEARTQP